MQTDFEVQLRAAFENEKKRIRADFGRIYDEILSEMREVDPASFTKNMVVIESRAVTPYYLRLKSEIPGRLLGSLPENQRDIIWMKAQIGLKAPSFQYCSEAAPVGPSGSVRHAPEGRVEKGRKGFTPMVRNLATVAGGAAAVELGTLFFPAANVFLTVLRVVGGLVFVASGAMAAREYMQGTVTLSPNAEKLQRSRSEQPLKDVVYAQRDLNAGILCKWLDMVLDAVLKVCAKG